MGLVKVKCAKCGKEKEFNEGVLTNISCQVCGNQVVIFGQDTILRCGKCLEFRRVDEGARFEALCCFKSNFIINPKAQPSVFIPSIKKEEVEKEDPENPVTAIVVCHDQLKYTQKCIKKLSKTSVFKIILVDNNSTDRTKEWAESMDFVYIRNQYNLGCGIARNQGAKRAQTKYLFFLDNDQYVPEDIIERLLEVKADLVGVENWEIDHEGNCRGGKGTPSAYSYIGAGGLLIKKKHFMSIGGFDERYAPCWYEDVDFSFRAKVQGYTLGMLPNHGVEHVSGITTNQQNDFDVERTKATSKKMFLSIWKDYFSYNNVPKEIEEKKVEEKKVVKRRSKKKPKIYILVDCPGWAWDNKTNELVKHLSDEFDFTVEYFSNKPSTPGGHDIYFTYEVDFYRRVNNKQWKEQKIITGVTAHTYVNMRDYEKILTEATAIHGNSMMLYEEIKGFNENHYYVPNGVNEKMFKYFKRDIKDQFAAGFVGKDNDYKGLKNTLHPACKKAKVDLKFKTSRVNDKNVTKHKDMPLLYKQVDVILIASVMDGTPNMLLEGAATGRTFIGNKIGNVPEFYNKENGFIIDDRDDIDAYAEKLVHLKEYRSKCAKMGVEARNEVERNWTWKIQAENYRQMFREVLDV